MAFTFIEKELLGALQVYGTVSAIPIPSGGAAAISSCKRFDLELAEGLFLDTGLGMLVPAQGPHTGAILVSVAGEPNLVKWQPGNWDVGVLCHREQGRIFWTGVQICRIDETGTGTPLVIASTTSLNIGMATREFFYTSGIINQAEESVGLATDRIYITLEFFNTHNSRDKSWTIGNDEGAAIGVFSKVVTPMDVPGGGGEVTAQLTETPAITFTANDPTASKSTTAPTLAASIVMTAKDPTATTARTATPDLAVLTFTANDPNASVATGLDEAKLSFVAHDPVVSTARTATPDTATMILAAKDPAVSAGAKIFQVRDALGNWVIIGGAEPAS